MYHSSVIGVRYVCVWQRLVIFSIDYGKKKNQAKGLVETGMNGKKIVCWDHKSCQKNSTVTNNSYNNNDA